MNKLKNQASILLGSSAKTSSIYTRMIRFFAYKKQADLQLGINKLLIHKALELLPSGQMVYLSIDRTNWQLGNQAINLLCIGVVLENRKLVPLLSVPLDKKGNSSQAERTSLLHQLLHLNAELKTHRLCLLGDREFIGKDWFAAMQRAGIDFVMRSRTGDYFQDVQRSNDWCSWELQQAIDKDLQKRKAHVSEVQWSDHKYYYQVQKNRKQSEKDATISWISSFSKPFDVSRAFEKRWQIEVFFADIKTKNFDLESMNFKDLGKSLMMLNLCSIVYLCVLIKGMAQRVKLGKTPIFFDKKMKKFYPRVSLIKLGMEAFSREIKFSIPKLDSFINALLKNLNTT